MRPRVRPSHGMPRRPASGHAIPESTKPPKPRAAVVPHSAVATAASRQSIEIQAASRTTR